MKKRLLHRKIGLILISSLMFAQVHAQFSKGTLIAGSSIGDISIGSSNYDYLTDDTLNSSYEGSNFSFSLYPQFGIFLNDKFAIGTEIDIYYYSGNSTSSDKDGIKYYDYKSENVSIGFLPYARYYFRKNSNGKSMLYGQISAGIRHDISDKSDSKYYDALGNITNTYSTDIVKQYSSLSGEIRFGWNKLITDNLAFDVNLGYTRYSSSDIHKNISTTGSITTISKEFQNKSKNGYITWSFGLNMFIPGKKADK